VGCGTCGGVLDCFCAGGGAVAVAAPVPPAPPAEPPHGVLPGLTLGSRRVDLVVYADRIVLSDVPGRSRERLFTILGFLCLGFVGALAGAALGRRSDSAGNPARVGSLLQLGATEVLRSSPRNLAVPVAALESIDVRPGGAQGRIVLREPGRGRMKLRWHRDHTGTVDVPAALRQSIGAK
jgi:hypothetical protein